METCGVVQPDGVVLLDAPDAPSRLITCARLVMTNCTSIEANARLCPEECPFLEMSTFSSCGHACVTARGCGAYRRAYSFPNPVTRVCEKCAVLGCEVCGVGQCMECRQGFDLDKDGTCVYSGDHYLSPVARITMLVMALCAVGALVMFFRCGHNPEALRAGLEHRRRCVPHQVENLKGGDPSKESYLSRSPMYPLGVNVHSWNIVGVGLALYYNHLVFIAFVSALSWFILVFADSFLSMHHWSVLNCGYGSDLQSHLVVVSFARRRCLMALFLWGCLLPASLVFARLQASAARTFDRVHTRMEDYVLSVRGLPPTAVDPLEIQRYFEAVFGAEIVGVSVGYVFGRQTKEISRLLDQHLARKEEAFLAALGVPGAFASARNRSHTKLNLLSQTPARRMPSTGDEASASEAADAPRKRPASVEEGSTVVDQEAQNFLASLRGSGEAFLVMRQEEDVEMLFALWDQPSRLQRVGSFPTLERGGGDFATMRREATPSMGIAPPPLPPQSRTFHGCPLELREVTSEPTSIVWEHMGTPPQVIFRRVIVCVIGFVASLVVFNVFYNWLAEYVLHFCQKAGQAPQMYHNFILACVLGAFNSLISNLIWLIVPLLGFRRKDQADIVVFLSRAFLIITNTIINLVMTIRKLAAVTRPEVEYLHAVGQAVARSQELGLEVAVATAVFQLFFIGTFGCGLVAQFITYPVNYMLAVLQVTTGLFGKKLTAREGERLLEPMEIWLPWDYALHIQLPFCAFFPLLLAEPPGQCAARGLCLVCLCWCVVMYLAQRIIHLRCSKETFFTTARLDTAVLYAWALPLALLALTAAWWAGRAMQLSLVMKCTVCVLAFLFSVGAYWIGLFYALRHQKNISVLYATKSESYEAALARLRYSFFNTNPVYVLMSEQMPRLHLQSVTWYEAGKAYLQTDNPRVDARLEASVFAAEHAPERTSMVSRALYQARVWLLGAPKEAYSKMDDSVAWE
eukprot:TRINITY_DN21455_c0_g1_i1.p1 TRINITY_DN21455_c0_g1~~TRINITY_DN21455_c0_g1_i1.p1  ORF type:complete len:1039 (+),score=176.63 TRINITY_DN21455_c0_g1_i1:204-3119(+)